jgi:acetolactate synthase I/II/III large subunit
MMKLSDYVIDFIYQQGVKQLFMLVGGGAMHLDESAGSHSHLQYVCNLHEQACAIAAQAYAHATNNLGAVLVTTGPGGTNTITGLAAAWIDSIPVLFISGQVKRSTLMDNTGLRQRGSQEVDITSVVKPLTKYCVRVMEADDIRYHLEKAVYLAKTGRQGPVWIDIPLDVQAIDIQPSHLRGFDQVEIVDSKIGPLAETIDQVINLVNNATRPIFLAGYGVQAAGVEEEFIQLAEKLNIPILVTWKAIGLIPDDHPLAIGRPGSIGQRGANFALQNSDLLIAIGARMDPDQVGFNYKQFARAAKKVIVDIDPSEINKLEFDIDLSLVTNAADFIRSFPIKAIQKDRQDRTEWVRRCQDWKKKYPVVIPEYYHQEKYVNMYVLMEFLSDLAGEGDLIVPGSSGPCANTMMQAWNVKRGQKFIFAPGLGSMGFGLPMSIGACVALDHRETICVNGDGGFQCNIQELETVSRLNLPVKYFVLNNTGYGSIMAMQRNYFNSHYVGSNPESGLTFPEITKVAHAYKIPSYSIKNQTSLKKRLEHILQLPGPVVCDVWVDPQQVQMPRVTSVIKPDGTLLSKPMEDLWPFLDREEFLSNMIIPPLPE